jgi:hypothetical protein
MELLVWLVSLTFLLGGSGHSSRQFVDARVTIPAPKKKGWWHQSTARIPHTCNPPFPLRSHSYPPSSMKCHSYPPSCLRSHSYPPSSLNACSFIPPALWNFIPQLSEISFQSHLSDISFPIPQLSEIPFLSHTHFLSCHDINTILPRPVLKRHASWTLPFAAQSCPTLKRSAHSRFLDPPLCCSKSSKGLSMNSPSLVSSPTKGFYLKHHV